MNPFDLPGPQFLAFYVIVAAVVYLAYRLALWRVESGEPPALPLNDPYQIAYLRGGRYEVARIAVLSLVDRGRVEIRGAYVIACGSATGLTPIDRAIVASCSPPVPARIVLADRQVAEACESYRTPLEELRLVPDRQMRHWRWQWFALAVVILVGIGVVKIDLALGRGRSNVGFLVALMFVAVSVLATALRRRRTALGDAVLDDLRRLFDGVRGYATPEGGATSDALLLAAVFGLAVLPTTGFAEVKQLFANSGSVGSGGCGSDGGGGGGCGGGCGGCGGCGGGD